MPNIENICQQLILSTRPAAGSVLTVDATGNDAEFVPAAAPVATGWTLIERVADVLLTGGATDPVLTFAVPNAKLVRFRMDLFYSPQAGGNQIKVDLTYPANSFLRNWHRGNDTSNVFIFTAVAAMAAADTMTDTGIGSAWMQYAGVFTSTAAGNFRVAITVPGGPGDATILRGSTLEYLIT